MIESLLETKLSKKCGTTQNNLPKSMFGNLPTAYKKAGFEQVKPRSYTDDEIIAALKNLAKEKERMPTFHEIVAASKAGKCPCPGTIVRRIGKLTEIRFTLLSKI